MKDLDKNYWDKRWQNGQTGWDIGYASPAIIQFMETYPDPSAKILIPGCGNAYEAEALSDIGFKDITLVDISAHAVKQINAKFINSENITCICKNFFELKGTFDLILEQTFFCALNPVDRRKYVLKCAELLNPGGKVAGVLFASYFKDDGPPFGGDIVEYRDLFGDVFKLMKLEPCYNSIPPRAGNELFFIMEKK